MTSIENQMNITAVFPDATLPSPTNGGFENQEEFRTFIMEHQGMNYLYRPTQMEQMPSLRFYAETEFIKMSEAQKQFRAP